MKKAILAALALTFMAAPIVTAVDASAQSRQELREDRRENRRNIQENRRDIREDRREIRQDRREIRQDRRAVNRPSWARQGGKYRSGGAYVSDHRRYGLRAPGRGQRWVRYNNDYILVTVASGLIGAIIAAQ